MDPGFDVASLPDDFPSELVPSSFSAGMVTVLGETRTVSFETSTTFDDIMAEYTDKIGEAPVIVEGEERLATWVGDEWSVTIFDSSPTLIGVTALG